MNDEELLKQAEANIIGAADPTVGDPAVPPQLIQESIAMSLLVIARNSNPLRNYPNIDPRGRISQEEQ